MSLRIPITVTFVALCASSIISVNFPHLEESNVDNFRVLGQMTREISLRYFSGFRCIAVITENYSVDNEGNISDFIPGNIGSYYIYITKLAENYNSRELILTALNEKCLGLIVQVSDPVQMILTVTKLSRRSLTRANRRFLFLPPATLTINMDRQYSLAVDDMLKRREMDFFPDLVVARFQTRKRIELVTQKFISESTYKEQVILDVWTERGERGRYGFLHMADLYPDKVLNLMGRRLVMATFNYRPYSIIDLNADPPVFDGTETRIALAFCKKLNATFDFSIDAENEWGEIYENDTGNGILGAVVEDRAELGYGAIYLWSYEYQYLDYSFPYIRTGITCLAPRPDPLAGWMTPLLPFTLTSWAAVWASVVASTFSLFLVTKATEKLPGRSTDIQAGTGRYASVLDCAFNALGLLVLQTPPDERRSTRNVGPNRHVLVWLTIMFLLVTTSYGSGLASILTVPRFGPPIDTVSDLVARNIPWAATHPAWMFSLRESRDPLTLHVTSQFRVMRNEELRKHSFMGDTAFSIERLPAGHYAVGDYVTEEAAAAKLRLMKQDLYFEFVPTVVRKGSPYISKLNKLIHRLLDSGLILKWEEQVRICHCCMPAKAGVPAFAQAHLQVYAGFCFTFVLEVVSAFLPMGVQRAVSQSRRSSKDDYGPTKLQYQHIEGSLYLLYLGLAISAVAFIGELLYNKCRPGTSPSE